MAMFHPATFFPAGSSHCHFRKPRHLRLFGLPRAPAVLLPAIIREPHGRGPPLLARHAAPSATAATPWRSRRTQRGLHGWRHPMVRAQRKISTARERRWTRGMNRVFDGPTSPAQVGGEEEEGGRAVDRELSRQQQAAAAAATIQACFRRHLARRALRALRSLVKVQAFARGAYVRKQADAAIRFMKVLVQLQVRVRGRQLLQRSS